MGIVEEYEHALAEPPSRRPRGYWIGWLVIAAVAVLFVSSIILNW